MTTQEWRQRLMQEKSDLDEKLTKLRGFIDRREFPAMDTTSQMLLIDQRHVMELYSDILRRRLLHAPMLGQGKPNDPGITGKEFSDRWNNTMGEVRSTGPVPDDDPPFAE